MKKIIILVAAIIVIAVIVVTIFNYKNKPDTVSVNNFEECARAGYPISESYPRQCKTPDNETFSENIGNELAKADLIRLTIPRPNEIIQTPLLLEGEARGYWYFEASFPVRLYDENNNLIAQAIAQAQSDWMTSDFVSFKAQLIFNLPETKTGILVLEKDNPSGLAENEDQLRVPVKFDENQETIKIKVYFNNQKLDPEFSCQKVFPVEREITKTPAIARAALDELLRGIDETEKTEGFSTSLNSGVKIQSLTIEKRIAKVDFNDQLEFMVGGSCRVAAIRAQVTQTLKQFSTVDEVVISVNGRTEDILQP